MSLDEEKALVAKASRDPQAFGRLYDEYAPKIFNYLFRRTLDFELANDLTSETFLKAYAGLWRFRWQGVSVAAWLYRIAGNEVKMAFRKKSYRPASLDELRRTTGFDVADESDFLKEKAEAERLLAQHEEFLRVQAALKKLPAKYQEALALRWFEQKSVLGICEILGKKEGTVKSLLSRGLEKIRAQLLAKHAGNSPGDLKSPDE